MKYMSTFCNQIHFCQKRFFQSGQRNLKSVKLSYSVCNQDSNDKTVTNTPSMVIIHGLFGSKRNFDSLAKVFSKKTGLQIISVDARNHGDSEHSEDMSYVSMAEDVVDLLKEFNLDRSVLLGHSMGGKIAMGVALMKPELVHGLVVVDMVPGRSVTADTGYFPKMINKLKSIEFDPSEDITIVTARKRASQQLAEVIDDIRVRDFLLTNLIQRNNSILWRLNLESIGNNYDSLMEFPDFSGQTYQGRTIFIGGSKSDMIVDKHKPIIKKFFPNSEVIHVIGSGHWVHADNPQEFSNLVTNFVDNLTK